MVRAKKKHQRKIEIIKTACKLFAERGYYNTTIPDIAEALNMSVGNFYNYFDSKEELAKEIMIFTSRMIGEKIRIINGEDIPFREKTYRIVRSFLETAIQEPELINYFLRVFLVNREIFKEGCEGFTCVADVVTELMIFLSDGAEKGELKNQDFLPAFVTIMGPIGGIVFLHSEGLLDKPLMEYAEQVANNVWNALKATGLT